MAIKMHTPLIWHELLNDVVWQAPERSSCSFDKQWWKWRPVDGDAKPTVRQPIEADGSELESLPRTSSLTFTSTLTPSCPPSLMQSSPSIMQDSVERSGGRLAH